jgi:hypothetical protein
VHLTFGHLRRYLRHRIGRCGKQPHGAAALIAASVQERVEIVGHTPGVSWNRARSPRRA